MCREGRERGEERDTRERLTREKRERREREEREVRKERERRETGRRERYEREGREREKRERREREERERREREERERRGRGEREERESNERAERESNEREEREEGEKRERRERDERDRREREKREKRERVKSEEIESEQGEVAGLMKENRNFIGLELGGQSYKALFDPGAMLSLVGPAVAARFSDRLEDSNTAIRTVTGGVTRVLGTLKVMLEIDGVSKALPMNAVPNLDQEIILGMDFCRLFDVGARLGRRRWRVDEGRWRPFIKDGGEIKSVVFEECAGISELKETKREALERLLERLLVYAEGERELGLTTLTEHSITLLNHTPIKHHLRRMSPKIQQIAIEEVERLFVEGIIERSASDYSSAPVMIRKSDETYRFCVDYRDLNKVTRKDAYPIPSMNSILDKLRRARYLTKMDLKQVYYQIPMEPASRKYTAFAVPGSGLWQFRRMPFGLTNAPMTFQRLIDSLFGPETFEEHRYWVELVLKRLAEAKRKVNKEKCEVCCSRVAYLGFLLDKEGLRPDPDKVAPVLDYPTPRNIKQLRRFLGIVGWYARFINNESSIKIPLVKLLHKSKEWQWGEDQKEAFETLKRALITAPVLARPDFSKPFLVQCDTSNFAIGAVLTQQGEDGEHPIV